MRHLSWPGLAAAVPAGLLSCALLMINNLRDIKSDPLSGKRTLAVRIGDARSRVVYTLFLLVPFVLAAAMAGVRRWTLLTLLVLPLAVPPLRIVHRGGTGPALITVLGQTSRLQIAFGIALPSASRSTADSGQSISIG
jgi:1,4-dihydroxy-2-naphthoate octaprenyltransferase